MHIPDGFLNPVVSAAAGITAAGGFAVALRQARSYLTERLVPLAALVAAFVFAAQMVNFPVLPGMSGHLIGAVLAAVLVGPAAGFIIITIVLVLQAFLFADGGLSALGLNILNMALVGGVGGYYLYRLIHRAGGGRPTSAAATAGFAAFLSVPLIAGAFAVEFAFAGTTDSVSLGAVSAALVGVHAVIGLGEGFITLLVVGAVMRTRPDLVYGMRSRGAAELQPRRAKRGAVVFVAALGVVLAVAAVVSQVASDQPDGLEYVAEQQGFAASADGPVLDEAPLADYGRSLGATGLAVAGLVGVAVTIALAAGVFWVARSVRSGPEEPAAT